MSSNVEENKIVDNTDKAVTAQIKSSKEEVAGIMEQVKDPKVDGKSKIKTKEKKKKDE
jgi:hypothetical protein